MKSMLAIIPVILLGTILPDKEWRNREYGIGVATVSSPYQVELIFYASPKSSAPQVARFRADTLSFFEDNTTVRSYGQMIEISYHEIGFPILGFGSDSQWVKVSLDCHNLDNTSFGWLSVRAPGLTIQSWSEIFSRPHSFFFLKPEWMTFYSEPKLGSVIKPTIVLGSYQLHEKSIKNRWMEVELETPSSFCRGEEEVVQEFGVKPTKRVVWIQFLDKRNRPRIFYYTRGC